MTEKTERATAAAPRVVPVGPFCEDRSPVGPAQFETLLRLYPGAPPAYLAVWASRMRTWGARYDCNYRYWLGAWEARAGDLVQADGVFCDGEVSRVPVVCEVLDQAQHLAGGYRLPVRTLVYSGGQLVARPEVRVLRLRRGEPARLPLVVNLRGGC